MPLLHAVNTRNLQHPLETLFLFSTLESDLEILITTISQLVRGEYWADSFGHVLG